MALLMFALFGGERAWAQVVTNGSFELPVLPASSSLASYQSGFHVPGWTFLSVSGVNAAGLISPPSDYAAPLAPDGAQVAFLQEASASFSQTITVPAAGPCVLTYFVAGRPNNGTSGGSVTYSVLLDSTILVTNAVTTDGQGFTLQTVPFTATAGSHLLAFINSATLAGDNTAFFDDIQIATVITNLFNTGVDASGTALSGASTDPHYALVHSADSRSPGPAAYVFQSFDLPGNYVGGNGLNSAWIAPQNSAEGGGSSNGYYDYQTTFNLSASSLASTSIPGSFAADDSATILLNGRPVSGASASDPSQWYPFTITSGFVGGLNTLDFIVNNASGYTGLRVTISGTTLPLSTNGFGPGGCEPAPSGLVSWWPGNGNALDIQGGNNGTLEGGVTFATGEAGQGFSFNGVDGYVETGTGVIPGGTSDFTVELWATCSSAGPSFQEMLSQGSQGNAFYIGTDPNNNIRLGDTWMNTGIPFPLGGWHHFAVTKTSSNTFFYIDGVNRAAAGYAISNPAASSGFRLGRQYGSLGEYWPGSVDEVSIYNRALSPGEIAQIYLAGSAGKCASGLPPVIVQQPQSVVSSFGENAAFSTTIQGTSPFTFQWQFNGTNLPGATNQTLSLTNLVRSQVGVYSLAARNPYGNAISSAVSLSGIFPIYWTNTSGGNWSAATNWSPNQVPGPFDQAMITANGTYLVTLDTSPTIYSLTLGGAGGQQTLANANSSLTLDNASVVNANGVLDFTGGNFTSSGALTVNGIINWQNASWSPMGGVTVASGAVLNLLGNLNLYGPLTNQGTVNWQAGNMELFYDGNSNLGEIWNQPGGVWNMQCNQNMYSWSGQEQFQNAGALLKNNSSGSSIIYPYLQNSGLVEAQSGTIQLNGNGNLGGSFVADANTAIYLAGNYTNGPATSLTGAGHIALNGGAMTLQTNVIANLNLDSGTVYLSSTFQEGTITNLTLQGGYLDTTNTVIGNLTLNNATLNGSLTVLSGGVFNGNNATLNGTVMVGNNGVFDWSGGLPSGSSLTVGAGGTLNITGSIWCAGPVNNQGTVNWKVGSIQLYYDGNNNLGEIWNQVGAVWNIQCDQPMYWSSGLEQFNNAGVLRKNTTFGTSIIYPYFQNSGTVEAQTGTIQFNDGGNFGGSFIADAGATMDLNGTYNSGPAVHLSGAGSFFFNGGTLTLLTNVTPNLQLISGTVVLDPSFQGGTITNLTLNGATLSGNYTISGSLALNNDSVYGMLTVLAGGVCSVSNMVFEPGSSLDIAANGVLNIGSTIWCYGPVTNQGTVHWQGGDIRLYYDGNNYFGEIWNQPGAVWNIQCDQAMDWWSGQEQFNNAGILRKNTTFGTSTLNPYFQNSGTVEAQTGTIQFYPGGGNLGGNFIADTNAAIGFSGDYSSGPAVNLSGAGSFQFNGGTLTLLTNLTPNLQLTGGTVVLDPSFQGGTITNLTLDGSTLSGNYTVSGSLGLYNDSVYGMLTVLAGGVCSVGGTTLGGGSSLDIAANGVLNITSTIWCYGPVTNQGTVNWQAGNIQLYYDGSSYFGDIWNQPGAVWNMQCDQTMYWSSGQEQFNNAGVLRKNTTFGTSSIYPSLQNSGLVEAQTGTIQFNDGGNLGGTFIADTNTAIILNGNYSSGPAVSLSGAGSFYFNGGTLTLLTNVTPNLQLTGGTVVLDPSFQGGTITNLTLNGSTLSGTNTVSGSLALNGDSVNGMLTVLAGGVCTVGGTTFSPASALEIATNGVLNIVSSVNFQGPVTNQGTVNWQAGSIDVISGYYWWGGFNGNGEIWNQPGGVWNLQCDQAMNWWSGDEQFNNAGVLRKNTTFGTTTIYPYFQNSGSVEAQTGTIQFYEGGGNLGGNFIADAGAAIVLNGAYSGDPALSLSGAGSFYFEGGTLTLLTNVAPNLQMTGGTIVLDPSFQGGTITNLTLDGATLSGTNTVSGSLALYNSSVNGMLTVLAGGVCSVSGTTFGQKTVLDIASNGVLNIGVPGGNVVAFQGPVTNQGTVNWQAGDIEEYYDGNNYLGEIWNQPGAVWNMQCDQSIYPWSGPEQFINAGVLRKTNSFGTTSFGLRLDNSGTVDAQSGLIDFYAEYAAPYYTLESGGTLNFGINNLFDYGSIYFSGGSPLNGMVSASFNNGYVPDLGDSFTPLTYGSGETGGFTGMNLPADVSWQTNYSSTSFTLTVLQGLEMSPIATQFAKGATLFTVTAAVVDTEVPPDSLTYSLVSPPSGMTIGAATGVIRWTPPNSASTNTIVVNVTDNGTPALQAFTSFSVIVVPTHVNVAPVLPEIVTVNIPEQALASIASTATDADIYATLAYSLVSAPAGAAIDTNGIVTWTPAQTQSPSTNVIVVAVTNSDPSVAVNPQLGTTSSFTVIVHEVNVAPELPVILTQTINKFAPLSVANAASEENIHATLAYGLVGAPSGMSINSSGLITWTPTAAQTPGTYLITTVATNTDLFDTVTPHLTATNLFTVVVADVNVAPTLAAIPTQNVNELALLTVNNAATETDTHVTLAYSLVNPPAGMAISSSGVITWTPAQTQSPSTNFITTIVSDWDPYDPVNPSLSATNTITVVVKEVNVAPVLSAVPQQTVNEQTLLTVTNAATESNIHATLAYGLANPLLGMSISSGGVFTWTPLQTQSPSTNVITTVVTNTDTFDTVNPHLYATNTFTVIVKEVNVAPTLPALAGANVNELNLLTVTNTATETDIHATLSYGLVGAPSGMAISPGGVITWTPTQTQSPSTNWITTIVTNTDSFDLVNPHLYATNSFAVIVHEVNVAPILPGIANTNINELTQLWVTNTAVESNIHATTTSYALVNPPAGMAISASGVITWTPSQTQSPSTNTITTVVSNLDSFDTVNPALSSTNTFTVFVKEVNVAPVLSVIPSQSIRELNLLTVTNAASESNIHATLAYGLVNPLLGMSISSSGVFTWTPSQTQSPSTNTITTVVTNTDTFDTVNPHLYATNTFTVVVIEANVAPALPVIPNTNINELTLLTVTNTATDSDIHATLSYTLLSPPAGASISANGIITWTPAQTQSPSTNTITVAAISTDPFDLVNPQVASVGSFTVTVKEVNVAPVLPVIPTQSVLELNTLNVTNTAAESNIHATLAYGLASAPSGMTINFSTGVITWTPLQTQSPSTSLVTTVVINTDTFDTVNPHLTATNTFTVVVLEANVPPVMPVIPTTNINELTLLTVTNTATDSNIHATLSYALLGPPAGASIDNNGIFTWTPAQTQSPSTNTIMVVAISTDLNDAVDTRLASVNTFTVIVHEVNVAPVLPVLPTQTVNELALLTVTNAAAESNIHATLAYGLVNPLQGMSISSSGVFTWTPSQAQSPSTNTITTVVTNTDTFDTVNPHLYATNTFTVIVYAPTLASIANRTVNVGQTIGFTASATDNDPTRTLTFSLVGAPGAATIGAASGVFSWRPGVAYANTTNTIVVKVSDNSNPAVTATQSFKAIVNPLASVLLGPVTYAAGHAQIGVSGPIGPDYILQASTTLTSGSWTNLLTNTPSVSPFTVTDTNAGAYSKRFYQIQLGP